MTDETTDYLLTDAKRSYEFLEENTSLRSIPEFLARLGGEFMSYDDKFTIPMTIITTLENPEHAENEDKCDLSDGEDEDERVEGRDGGCYHGEKVLKYGSKKLLIAIGISSLFFVAELVGGLISGSLALLSDSFHLLSDLISFMISLLSIYLSHRPASKSHTYGYSRAEILGALLSIFLIWLLTCYLCLEAYDRIRYPRAVDGKTMFIIASMGVFVNVLLIFVLGHKHHHHDNNGKGELAHSHQNGENVNVQAALLHALGDLLSSLGVLISSIVIIYDPSKVWVDPLCTFFFSALVMVTTFGILRSSVRVLMEATPFHIDPQDVKLDLKAIEGVKSAHDLHIWDLTVGKTVLMAHLKLQKYNPTQHSEPFTPSSILSKARKMLKKKYSILKMTIQVDES